MSTIIFDFRHYYRKGERRESDQIAYQWDLGHVAEIYVPVNATYEIHYCFADFTETDDYAVESITAAEDGGYKLTAHIPNELFERSGELKVYVIGADDNHVLTTYEGYITIRGRTKPEDYVDDDPENEATRILTGAREARDAAIEAAEQAEAAASQSAAQASIAEVYDATKTYAIGDYCLYDGQLYECTAEITTPEAWTAAHWTAATVGAELNDIQDDVSGLKEDLEETENELKSALLYSGAAETPSFTEAEGMINSSGSVLGTSPDRHTSGIQLNKGDKIIFYGYNYAQFAIISDYRNGSYYPLVVASESGYQTKEYIAPRNMTVVCSGTKTTPFVITVVHAIQEKIEELESALDYSGVSIIPDYQLIDGMINSSGTVLGGAPDRHTSGIALNAGDKVTFGAYNYSGFCIIAEVVNNTYKPIINCSASGYAITSYTATHKTIISCSGTGYYDFNVNVDRKVQNEIEAVKAIAENKDLLGFANVLNNQIKKNRAYKSEDYRPLFHMTTNSKWMNDPHGFVYYKGLYHIYYQHNDDVNNGNGKQRWGHFVSDDLISWQEHPDAFSRDDGSCWDGTCVIDSNNLLGLGADTLLQFYTFVATGTSNQDLCLAYSLDNGETFQKYGNSPLITWAESGQERVFRDPKIIYDSDNTQYVLVIAVDAGVAFYSSTDLLNWTYLSTFNSLDTTKTTECARLCKVDGQYVLIYSYRWNSQYWFIGTWNGSTFTSKSSGRLGYGEGYAFEVSSYTDKVYGVQFFNPNKLVNTVINNPYAMDSNGILSTVCELSIVNSAICMTPIVRTNQNIITLPSTAVRLYETVLGTGNAVQIKLHANVESTSTMEFTLKFNADDDGYDLVTFGFVSGLLDFYRGGEKYYSEAGFTRTTSCNIDTTGLTEFDLNVVVDVGCVEVYALGGKYAILGKTFNSNTEDKSITFMFHGDDFVIDSFEINPIMTAIPNKFVS